VIIRTQATFLDIARSPGAPEPFVQGDALDFLRRAGDEHDMIFCLDMIEHLDRSVGEELLRLVTARARRLAAFFTPIGPMLLNPADPTGHRAAWWPDEFEALGYRTWAFPRFHGRWLDGRVWGAFYAWRWTRPEPAAEAKMAGLAARFGLVDSAAAFDEPRYVTGVTEAEAVHWNNLRQLYCPRLFPPGDASA
jgi:hypothetical protein